MHLLFVHRNFPAQFGHLAQWLAREHGFECTFLSEVPPAPADGVRRLQYQPTGGARASTHYLSRTFENSISHAHGVYAAFESAPGDPTGFDRRPQRIRLNPLSRRSLRAPDHQLLRILLPWARLRTWISGRTFPPKEVNVLRARARNAMMLLDLQTCTAGYSPTEWQKSLFPAEYQPKLRAIFDGIDTTLWRRIPNAPRQVAGHEIPAGMRVVTYVARGFESTRGFDIFMKVAKRVCAARADVLFVAVGNDRGYYSGDEDFIGAQSFKEHALSQDTYDLSRIWFPGPMAPADLAQLLSLSDLHIYLTVPFVLSWSLMNALACGCTVLASDVPPVREMVRHGENGLLADFHDVDALSAAALRVLDDPAAFRPLGEAGMEMIQTRYSMAQSFDRLREFFQSVAAG